MGTPAPTTRAAAAQAEQAKAEERERTDQKQVQAADRAQEEAQEGSLEAYLRLLPQPLLDFIWNTRESPAYRVEILLFRWIDRNFSGELIRMQPEPQWDFRLLELTPEQRGIALALPPIGALPSYSHRLDWPDLGKTLRQLDRLKAENRPPEQAEQAGQRQSPRLAPCRRQLVSLLARGLPDATRGCPLADQHAQTREPANADKLARLLRLDRRELARQRAAAELARQQMLRNIQGTGVARICLSPTLPAQLQGPYLPVASHSALCSTSPRPASTEQVSAQSGDNNLRAQLQNLLTLSTQTPTSTEAERQTPPPEPQPVPDPPVDRLLFQTSIKARPEARPEASTGIRTGASTGARPELPKPSPAPQPETDWPPQAADTYFQPLNLAGAGNLLNLVAERIAASRSTQVLLHQSWVQPVGPNEQSPRIHILVPGSDGNPEVHGTFWPWQQRFLHLEADLRLQSWEEVAQLDSPEPAVESDLLGNSPWRGWLDRLRDPPQKPPLGGNWRRWLYSAPPPPVEPEEDDLLDFAAIEAAALLEDDPRDDPENAPEAGEETEDSLAQLLSSVSALELPPDSPLRQIAAVTLTDVTDLWDSLMPAEKVPSTPEALALVVAFTAPDFLPLARTATAPATTFRVPMKRVRADPEEASSAREEILWPPDLFHHYRLSDGGYTNQWRLLNSVQVLDESLRSLAEQRQLPKETILTGSFGIQEERKVESGEIHYFDHPAFGLVAIIQELTPEEYSELLSAASPQP